MKVNFYKIINLKERPKMLIFVRQANGNGLEVELDQNSSIKELYEWVGQKLSENDEKFSLFFRGKPILDLNESIVDLNIKQMDIIHLKWISNKGDRSCLINVNVFHLKEIYTLRINNRETVTKLKQRICEITYVHPKSQCLFFRGKKLTQTSTIIQQQIQNDSLISLILIGRKEPFEKYEGYFHSPERQLLESISSLKIKKTESQGTKASKSSLFRSDSWGIKLNEKYCSPQIQVKYVRNNLGLAHSIDSQAELNRLFNICMEGNSQQNKGKNYKNGEQVLLGGSCQLGQAKLSKSFRFAKKFQIEEHSQENQQNMEDRIEKGKSLESRQKTYSLYKKLQLDQSLQSIQFLDCDHIKGKSA